MERWIFDKFYYLYFKFNIINIMEKYKRKAVFENLDKYCVIAKEHDYIEVTEWNNGEGYDVEIKSEMSSFFQLTNGQLRAIKKLVKVLDKMQ